MQTISIRFRVPGSISQIFGPRFEIPILQVVDKIENCNLHCNSIQGTK